MSATKDYSALIGRPVIVYVGRSASYGPVRLVAIVDGDEGGHFVIEHWSNRDQSTVRRRGTTLRPY